MQYRQGWIVGVDEQKGFLIPYEITAAENGANAISFSGPLSTLMKEDFSLALNAVQLALQNAMIEVPEFDWHFHLVGNRLDLTGPSHRMSLGISVLSMHFPQIEIRPDEAVMTGDLMLCGKFLPVSYIDKKSAASRENGIETFWVATEQEIPEGIEAKHADSLGELIRNATANPFRESFIPAELRQ